MARGIDHMPGDQHRSRPGSQCCCATADCSSSLRPWSRFTSPTPPCCRWLGGRTTEQGLRHRFDGDVRGGRADRDGADGYLAGAKADSWGRKPIFLVGFAFLTLRGFLYTVSDNSFWLVGQILDGVGAGIFGALFPLVVQDLTQAPAVSTSALVR